MAKRLLVQNNNLWHLAQLTENGVQLDIDNFVKVTDARRKLSHGSPLYMEIGANEYLHVEATEQLNRISNGHGPDGTKHLKSLKGFGLIDGTITKKKTKTPPVLTDRGRKVLEMAR